jgi:hypothetical protein
MPPKAKPPPSPSPTPTPTPVKSGNAKPLSPIQQSAVQETASGREGPLATNAFKPPAPQPGTNVSGKPQGEATTTIPKPSTDSNGVVTKVTKSSTTDEKTSIEESVEITTKKLMAMFKFDDGGKYFLDASIHHLIADFHPFVHKWMEGIVRQRVNGFIEKYLVGIINEVRTTTIREEKEKWEKEIVTIKEQHAKDSAKAINHIIGFYEKKMTELDIMVHVKFRKTSIAEKWLANGEFPPELSDLKWPAFEPEVDMH